ncbi:MAG: XdhC family protein, partial [Actinomycetota bacterium]
MPGGGAAVGSATPPAGPPRPGADRPHVEATAVKVVGTPPCRVGNRMSIVPGGEVHGTLGCAEFDAAAVEAAAGIAARGEPETLTLHHDLGDIEVYFEPHTAPPHLVAVSATDVARALRTAMQPLGYRTTLVESRDDRVATGDAPRVASLEDLDLDTNVVVVLTDHDAPDVVPVLTALLRSSVRFIGVMGSRRHVAHYVDTLRSQGFTDDELARIRSPLGLDLGGRSAEEIA